MSEPVPEEPQPPPPAVPPIEEPQPAPPAEGEPQPGTPEQQDDEAELEDAGDGGGEPAGFNLEAFVKSLPDGVALCPMCLGAGGVVEEPPFDPTVHICPTCIGQGKVRTGSLVPNNVERPCSDCEGRGWQPNEPGTPPATPAAAAHFAQAAPRDRLGHAPDDPDFDWSSVAGAAPPPAAEPEPVSA